jgi:hypothetical protein
MHQNHTNFKSSVAFEPSVALTAETSRQTLTLLSYMLTLAVAAFLAQR